MDILERHEYSSTQREELAERLADRGIEELQALVLWMAERHPAAARLARLRMMDEGEAPDVDVEALGAAIDKIVAPVSGAFGRPDSRGDHAIEADFKKLARRGRDYEAAGYTEAAQTVYSVVAEGLEENSHRFNPHRGWHRSLREVLMMRLDAL